MTPRGPSATCAARSDATPASPTNGATQNRVSWAVADVAKNSSDRYGPMSRWVTSQRTPATIDGATRAWKTPNRAATVAATPQPRTYGAAVSAPWMRSTVNAAICATAQTPSLTAAAAG